MYACIPVASTTTIQRVWCLKQVQSAAMCHPMVLQDLVTSIHTINLVQIHMLLPSYIVPLNSGQKRQGKGTQLEYWHKLTVYRQQLNPQHCGDSLTLTQTKWATYLPILYSCTLKYLLTWSEAIDASAWVHDMYTTSSIHDSWPMTAWLLQYVQQEIHVIYEHQRLSCSQDCVGGEHRF